MCGHHVREQTGRKNFENSRKSMQLNLNFSLTGTREMEVLRSLSILNPEEMNDTELPKDLRSLGKLPSFDGKDTMLINTAVDTRETTGDIQTSRRDTRTTPYEKTRGQKIQKRDSSIGGTSPRSTSWSESERPPQSHQRNGQPENQHIEMPQIQYTDKIADKSVAVQRQVSPRTTETKHRIFKLTVNICMQRIFRLIDLAHEITGVKVAQKTWHKLLDDRQHATESSHIAPTKEAVADDTANGKTDITFRVSQTTLSDFSKNVEEPSPQRKRRRLMIRYAAWILTRYSVRRSTGVIFVQTPVQCSFRTRS